MMARSNCGLAIANCGLAETKIPNPKSLIRNPYPGPRMAKFLPLAVVLALFAGCAQQHDEELPSANFNGPIVQPPPAPVETVKPPEKTVTPQPRPTPQVATTGI